MFEGDQSVRRQLPADVDVGNRPDGLGEAGDDRPSFFEWVCRRFGGSGLGTANVLRQNTPSRTGPRDRREIQTQFPGQPAGRRSGAHRTFRSGRRALGGSARGLGGRFRGKHRGLWLPLGDGGFEGKLQFGFVGGDIGQHGFHRGGFAFLDGDFLEETVAGGLDLGVGLLGLDLDHRFTLDDGIAFLLDPSHDGPLFHGDGQLGQLDCLHIPSSVVSGREICRWKPVSASEFW